MKNREFIPCLNKEYKIYNCNYASIFISILMLILVGSFLGMLWGLGAGAIGFTIGAFLGKQWYLGKIQRKLYWYFPYSKIWLDSNIPESSERYEL